jgi:hypothetical protein
VIEVLRVAESAVLRDQLFEGRIRAGGEVGRIGKGEDLLDITQGAIPRPDENPDRADAGEAVRGNGNCERPREGRTAQDTRPDLTRMSVRVPEETGLALGSSLAASDRVCAPGDCCRL